MSQKVVRSFILKKHLLIIIFLLSSLLFSIKNDNTVLIIGSYHPELAWVDQCEEGIESSIDSNIQVVKFYMDTKRIPESSFNQKVIEALRLIEEVKPDLIMLGDDNALKLIGPELAGKEIPVVFFGINTNPRHYFENLVLPSNFTGVLEHFVVIPWIGHLKKIMPDAEKALVMFDHSSTTEAIIHTSFYDSNVINIAGLEIEYNILPDWNNWKQCVQNCSEFDMIILPTFHAVKDKDKAIDYNEVIRWTSRNTKIPLFTFQDYAVRDDGCTGAFVLHGVSHGKVAGEMVQMILIDKKPPGKIVPVPDTSGKFFFNKKQLKRFSIALPEYIKNDAIFK